VHHSAADGGICVVIDSAAEALTREVIMAALNRRALVAATAAGVVAPTVARAGECPAAGMDWMTMSLEARNLAYFNVAHVGADFARQKTEGWAAASKMLREQHPKHLDLAYGSGERTKWDLYPAADPKAYTLAPEASLTQITSELRTAFDWLTAKGVEHGIEGPIIVTGWSAGGHLTAFLLDHPKVAAGLSISGVFELAPLRDSPHVNDKVRLTEVEIETLSPMRRPSVNKVLSIAYGTGELPAMIATSRDYHAYRSKAHLPGDLIPIAKANHFTILDELMAPDSNLTRAVMQLAKYKVA
jgi:arylformamidase